MSINAEAIALLSIAPASSDVCAELYVIEQIASAVVVSSIMHSISYGNIPKESNLAYRLL